MQHARSSARRGLAAVLSIACGAALVPIVAQPSGAQPEDPQAGPGLGVHDRELVAEAEANGEATVTLVITSSPGAAGAVADELEALGGDVAYRDDSLGYLRVEVPTGVADQAARVGAIETVDVDEIIPLDDPRPDGIRIPPVISYPPPDASTPRDNPYMPIADTGAAAFLRDNPTWDGRGVTVGVLDSGITLDHPALATTTTGAPKIVDWVTYTHPATDNDPTWIEELKSVRGPTFTHDNLTYTTPAAGRFSFGLFDERDPRLGGEVGNDVNRDGNPAGSSGLFGVLWRGNLVWVDVDQDQSFADEPLMTEYRVNRDVRYFGTDNPATPVKEAMPFVVETEIVEINKAPVRFVNIGIVSAAHGTHVAGIVAANGMFGGAMSGAAPGAQLVSVRVCLFIAGCTNSALIEGMIYAVKRARVDVINMSIGGLPALNDANTTRAELYDRLIQRYGVQMYFSAGNSGPGENTVGDPSVTTRVMSVGTYISNDTWLANYGSVVGPEDNQNYFSSRGPREDGGFKPNIIAPGSAISTTPLWQAGGPLPGVHVLPPGYSMFNGTSMASPQAAGAGALLVSAARAVGVDHDAARLRQALNSSTRFISGYGAFEQGNGLIDVGAAWKLMEKDSLRPVEITSAVTVSTALSPLLATPNVGVGIHDREGVVEDRPYSRTYRFTRQSGGSATYQLSLVGNDGTFSLGASSIGLRSGEPQTLLVNIDPQTPGVHSAILNMDDRRYPGIEYQTLNTVIVPYEFSAAGGYERVITGTVGRNQALHYFFRVPPQTPAFKVDFTGPDATPGTGQARFLRFHPYGVGIESNATTNCFSPPAGPCNAGESPNSRTVVSPYPGVWEVTVDARRTSDADTTPFTLTASVLGATVSPDPDVIASVPLGVEVERTYTLTNLFGPFVGRAVGTPFGSARIERPEIAHGVEQSYEVFVTAGSTALRATIGNTSDAGADLDLFVYNCTTGTCVLAGQSADGDSEESVTIANPAAGRWQVLVDGFDIPARTTTYDYVDVFTNTGFGGITVDDADALRPAGAVWTVTARILASDAPAAGRQLLGQIEVRTDTNVLVGSGDVVVQTVGPPPPPV